jgi:mannose-6-phosphate isomerase-like protein (cupin superfamily)
MKQSYKTCAMPARDTGTMEQAIDLRAKLAAFEGHWHPRTVCEYNGHDVMVVKVQGDYQWHVHPDTDDFFLVLKGELFIDLEDGRTVRLEPGQLFVVPSGMQHRPRAPQEAHLLLIEPTGTPNSGDPATAAPRRVI